MIKKNYQTIEVNGREMMFNLPFFQEMFLHMAKQEEQKIQQYEKHLAEIVFVNESTVHNWRQSRNCPGSIDIIRAIAGYWKIPVERLLVEAESPADDAQNPENALEDITEKMKEVARMDTRRFTDREKEAVLRIYDQFLYYMEAFKKTGGFMASMDLPEDEFGPTDEAYTNMKEELLDRLKHAVYREYIDLRDTIYEELKFFVDNGVDDLIYDALEEAGEFDEHIDSVCFDEDTSEEEREETLAQMKEDEESFFLAIYIGCIEYFQNIVDPYL